MSGPAGASAAGPARRAVAAALQRLAEVADRLPAEARSEVGASARRLALAARSPRRLLDALGVELERLLAVLVPMAARTPLPVSPASARALVGTAAGAAAAVAEAEAILLALSAGVAAPGMGAVALAWLTAWAVEVWGATSARIAQLKAAGHAPDPAVLVEEVASALAGRRLRKTITQRIGRRLARRVAARLARRWAYGMAPGVGIAYDALDAQRTVKSVLALPLDTHPRAPSG